MKRPIDLNKNHQLKLPSLMNVIITTTVGLLIGYLGPFGTFQMPLTDRLLYWLILIAAGDLVFTQTAALCRHFMVGRWQRRIIILLVSSVLGAVVLTFFVAYITHWLWKTDLAFPQSFGYFFPKVLSLSLALNAFGYLLDEVRQNQTDQNTPESNKGVAESTNPFLNRLPKHLGTELIGFSMEDHYLRVYTQAGDDLLLMRMKDALIELADYPGMQVHRSWWVALDAVEKGQKQGRKVTLLMQNGLEVPVSQSHQAAVKAAGLL